MVPRNIISMSKNERLVVLGTLGVIIVLSVINFGKAQVLSRDIQRKNDLRHTAKALDEYFKDNNGYPGAFDGKIVACGSTTPAPCRWAGDTLGLYMGTIPQDPLAASNGYSYSYFSSTREFQVYAHLERIGDGEYNKSIESRGLKCGNQICNFGVASGNTPLDQDLPVNAPATESALPNGR